MTRDAWAGYRSLFVNPIQSVSHCVVITKPRYVGVVFRGCDSNKEGCVGCGQDGGRVCRI